MLMEQEPQTEAESRDLPIAAPHAPEPPVPAGRQAFGDAAWAAKCLFADPGEGTAHALREFSDKRAIAAGSLLCAAFGVTAAFGAERFIDSLGFIGSLALRFAGAGHFLRWVVIRMLPVLSLAGIAWVLGRMQRSECGMGGALLLAGCVGLPTAAAWALMAVLQLTGVGGLGLMLAVLTFGACLSLVVLHGGWRFGLELSPRAAALAVPGAILGSLLVTGIVYRCFLRHSHLECFAKRAVRIRIKCDEILKFITDFLVAD